MSVQIDTPAQWQHYIQGVLGRASHHAPHVQDAILPLVGAVITFHNPTRPVRVMEREGETTNVIWFYIGDQRFVLTFSHNGGAIELRQDSLQGPAEASFDNQSTHEILVVFEALAGVHA